ncbi:hypothetical protein HGRIS_012622 [Hohenbuehelia grisea]|uniref:Mif2/CENP-C cupin domain-containing protein n=1 Tax=Hohenbuehelia grisea TaxID=104357 RepID=A0ABR3ISY7_9AGAR
MGDPGDAGGMDGYGPQEDSPPGARTSFTDMNQDDDDDDDDGGPFDQFVEPEPEDQPRGRSVDKGKRRAIPEPEMEDAIEQGLDELEDQGDQAEDEPDERPGKKTRAAEKAKRPPVKPRAKRQPRKEASRSPTPDGVRRSKRHRYGPLEWWRQERVVYGRRDSNSVVLVPHIKEIVRIPKEPAAPLGKNKRKRGGARARSKSKTNDEESAPPVPFNPEEGWDDDTDHTCIVNEYTTNTDVTRRIAWTSKMFHPQPAANADWSFQKIFGDGNFIAAGQLIIPPKGRKPSKPTKDNTYIFYVIEGAVNLRIHQSSLILATGAMFMVPRGATNASHYAFIILLTCVQLQGNTYFIENISDRDAKLVFTQARKMHDEADAEETRRLSEAQALARASTADPSSSGAQPDRTALARRAASTKI